MLSSLLYLIQPENKINSQSIQNTMFGQYREIRLDTYKNIFHKVLMNYDTKIISQNGWYLAKMFPASTFWKNKKD